MTEHDIVDFAGNATIWLGLALIQGFTIIGVLEVWWKIFRYVKGIPKLIKHVNKIVEQELGNKKNANNK